MEAVQVTSQTCMDASESHLSNSHQMSLTCFNGNLEVVTMLIINSAGIINHKNSNDH